MRNHSARRAHAVFSAASEPRAIKWPLDSSGLGSLLYFSRECGAGGCGTGLIGTLVVLGGNSRLERVDVRVTDRLARWDVDHRPEYHRRAVIGMAAAATIACGARVTSARCVGNSFEWVSSRHHRLTLAFEQSRCSDDDGARLK